MTRLHYVSELESARQNMIEMGATTLALFDLALGTIAVPDAEAASKAQALEEVTDEQNRRIHEQCLSLITLQAPVARDARLVTGILEGIVDVELIADYAAEISWLSVGCTKRPTSQIANQVRELGDRIRAMLAVAIESWRTEDREQALSVRPHESVIRSDCQTLYEKLAQLTSLPGDPAAYVNLLLICRHLERIARHSVNVAELAAAAAPAIDQRQ